MRYILCIDQGTTSTKAFLLDEEGNLSQGTHVPFKQYYPQPGWVSHDAEEIYVSVLKAIAMLLKEHPEANLKIAVLSEEVSPVAIPIRKGAENATFLAAVNEAIEALRADGTLKAISEKYFGGDITTLE